jgi:hypothetical protein
MKGLLAACLIALVVLSGCFGKGTTSTTGTPTGSFTKGTTSVSQAPTTTGPVTATSTPSSTTNSSTTGPPANHAPTATLVASNSTGTIPFNVTFSISGSDADNDTLTYSLAFGDGGTPDATGSVPANVTHAFTLVGNFTVRLTVKDATHSVNATLVVHAAKAAQPKVLTGDVQKDCAASCEGCVQGAICGPAGPGAGGCASFTTAKPGVDCFFWAVTDAAGKPFTLTSTGGDPDAEFFDKCDPAMGTSLGAAASNGPETGDVPAGTGCIVAWEYKSIAPGGKSTLTFTYG